MTISVVISVTFFFGDVAVDSDQASHLGHSVDGVLVVRATRFAFQTFFILRHNFHEGDI